MTGSTKKIDPSIAPIHGIDHMPTHSEDSTPRPDPTFLTTQQLASTANSLREILEAEIEGLKATLDTRLSSLERAVETAHNRINHLPEERAVAISRLQELHEEKFHSIATQFAERDTRTEQTSRDSKVAVDAALQAAKEAVGEQNKSNALAIAKSEAAFTKQIDQIGILVETKGKATDDMIKSSNSSFMLAIGDIKDRLTTIESSKKGGGEVWALIGTLAGIAFGGAAAAAAFYRH
jgi:cation transport regulator ChaB